MPVPGQHPTLSVETVQTSALAGVPADSASNEVSLLQKFGICEAVRLIRGFPLSRSLATGFDSFNFFDSFNLDIFDFCRLLLQIQRLTILSVWRASCPYWTCNNGIQVRRDAMSPILMFIRKWNKWYRVLRYRKGFGLLDSMRYGLWLAHS